MSEANVFIVIEILPGSLPRVTSLFVRKESIAKDYPEQRLIIAFISALLFHHPAVYLRGFAPFTLITMLHCACLPPSLTTFPLHWSRLQSFWLSSSESEHATVLLVNRSVIIKTSSVSWLGRKQEVVWCDELLLLQSTTPSYYNTTEGNYCKGKDRFTDRSLAQEWDHVILTMFGDNYNTRVYFCSSEEYIGTSKIIVGVSLLSYFHAYFWKNLVFFSMGVSDFIESCHMCFWLITIEYQIKLKMTAFVGQSNKFMHNWVKFKISSVMRC